MKFKNIFTKFLDIYQVLILPYLFIYYASASGVLWGLITSSTAVRTTQQIQSRLPIFISSAFRTRSAPQVHLSFFRTGSGHEVGLSDGSTSISLTTFLVLG